MSHCDEPEGFGLLHPFHIDAGQLDGIPAHECFVLGVEWQMFCERLDASERPFKRLIHTHNAERLSKLAQEQGRFCEVVPSAAVAEGWSVIHVGGPVHKLLRPE